MSIELRVKNPCIIKFHTNNTIDPLVSLYYQYSFDIEIIRVKEKHREYNSPGLVNIIRLLPDNIIGSILSFQFFKEFFTNSNRYRHRRPCQAEQ